MYASPGNMVSTRCMHHIRDFDKQHEHCPTFHIVCKVQENEPVAIEPHQVVILWIPEYIEYAVFVITQVQNSLEPVDHVCKVR
jgi:hypothetical protein